MGSRSRSSPAHWKANLKATPPVSVRFRHQTISSSFYDREHQTLSDELRIFRQVVVKWASRRMAPARWQATPSSMAEASELRKHRGLRDHRCRLLPPAAAAQRPPGASRRRILAGGDLIEGAPLRFHPHVGVSREHGARNVPGDAHDHLVARARLREFRDQRVAATRKINVIAPRERLEQDVSDKEFHRGL